MTGWGRGRWYTERSKYHYFNYPGAISYCLLLYSDELNSLQENNEIPIKFKCRRCLKEKYKREVEKEKL